MALEIKISKVFGGHRITATSNEEPVGYLDFIYNGDESKGRNVEIQMIYTNPEHRRQGIARTLLEILKTKIDAVWFTLWTGKQCEIDGSYKLYSELEFEEVTKLDDYYATGIPARLFRWRKQ